MLRGVVGVRKRAVVLGFTTRDLLTGRQFSASVNRHRLLKAETYTYPNACEHVVHQYVIYVIFADQVANKHPFRFFVLLLAVDDRFLCHASVGAAKDRFLSRYR